MRVVFFLAPALFFLFFDALLPSVARAVKQHGELGIATAQSGKRWRNIVLISMMNLLLGIALQMGIEALLTRAFKVKTTLRITTTLPFPWAIGKDLMKGYAAREVKFGYRRSQEENAD